MLATCNCQQYENEKAFKSEFISRGNNKTHSDIMQRVRYFRPLFINTGGPQEFFFKAFNIKFHGHPPSGSHADNMQTDGQT